MKSKIIIVGAIGAVHMALALQAGAEVICSSEARERGILGEPEPPRQVLPLVLPEKRVYEKVDLRTLGFGSFSPRIDPQFKGFTSTRRRYK